VLPRVKKPVRRLLLLLLAVILFTPPIANWAIDAWLESSGGRQILEKNLSERTGMNVRLGGEFDLMLLPAIGVSGTDLAIESASALGPLASSAEYEISVALRPLFDGLVLIDWIRLSGGEIHPDRYRPAVSATVSAEAGPVRIPEIRELTIRDFKVVLPGGGAEEIRVAVLEVSDFADSTSAPFLLEIEGLVSAQGRVVLDMSKSSLEFHALALERAGQRLAGDGCINFGDPLSIDVVLEAERLDLDLLREDLPGSVFGSGGEGQGTTPAISVRVSVEELIASGALARDVVLSLGEEPVCGSD
jgi:hypothetical protein